MIRADADSRRSSPRPSPTPWSRPSRTRAAVAPFARAFDAYLADWGFRCSAELMLTSPSFQENPAALIAALEAYAERDGESPEALLARQQAERLADTARVLAMVGRAEVRLPCASSSVLDAALDPVAGTRPPQTGAPLQPAAPRRAGHRRRALRRRPTRAARRRVHADVRRAG